MILVTGAAGFIGAHVCAQLASQGDAVIGCDNFNDYYDPAFKRSRIRHLLAPARVSCEIADIADAAALEGVFKAYPIKQVIHLAAQAGVRTSLTQPERYVQSNLVGFANILEVCRKHKVEHLVYASSSSVYGRRNDPPFREEDAADQPASFYAATKRANELMAHAYAETHGLVSTGLRFFTVYGPWGRPDMAYFTFTQKIRDGQPIPVFEEGKLQRDFTYVDDIVQAVVKLLFKPPPSEPGAVPHQVFNIGNHRPVEVMTFIQILESVLKQKAKIDFQPRQPGDVPLTAADTRRLHEWIGFEPNTPLELGLSKFASWFDAWRSTQNIFD